MLYSNSVLLKKYKRKIPETWDEFLDTSKYILKKEKELNNTNLMIYNGLYNGIYY